MFKSLQKYYLCNNAIVTTNNLINMKKILFVLAAILLMTACTSMVPGQITRLADKVEANGADFSPAQWEKANAQLENLLDKYVDNYDKFNASQRKEIANALGRYGKAAVKAGVTNATTLINSALQELPSALDGIIDEAKGFLEGLGL